MTKENEIVSPGGTRIDISDLETGVKEYVTAVYAIATDEFSKTEYGHAALALASSVIGAASSGATKEEQADFLRRCALEKIAVHGPNIIPLLRDELRLALTEADLRSVGYNKS